TLSRGDNGALAPPVSVLTPSGVDQDHQIPLTAGNVIAEGLEHPQGPHRVHIEYMGPGFVVDIADLLPRRAGNPGAGVVTPLRTCGSTGGSVAKGMKKISYRGYRFSPEIIHQAIWLYSGAV